MSSVCLKNKGTLLFKGRVTHLAQTRTEKWSSHFPCGVLCAEDESVLMGVLAVLEALVWIVFF